MYRLSAFFVYNISTDINNKMTEREKTMPKDKKEEKIIEEKDIENVTGGTSMDLNITDDKVIFNPSSADSETSAAWNPIDAT